MSLFPPPKIIKTEVFASVPERYRKKGVVTHWVETHRGGAPTDCFLEGPSFIDVLPNHLVSSFPDDTTRYPLAPKCLPQNCLRKCANSSSNTRELIPFNHCTIVLRSGNIATP